MNSYEEVLIVIQAFFNTVVDSFYADHFSFKTDQ